MFELALQDASGTTLVPRTELIQAVARIRNDLALADHEAAFAVLVDFLNATGKLSNADAAKVEAIVVALGGAQELLARLRTLMQGFGIALPPDGRPRMKSLADLAQEDGEKTYPLFRAGAAAGSGADQVALSIGAASSAVLELQTYDAQHGADIGFAIPAGSAVQRIGVNGSVQLKGDARGPLGSAASVQAGGGVTAGSTLDFYFQFDANTPLVTALVDIAEQIGAPWRLEAALTRLQPVAADGGCTGFRRIHMRSEGSLDFAGAISVGQGWKYEAGRGGAAVGMEAGAGLTLNASIRHSGLFEIRVEKDLTGAPLVDIRHTGSGSNQGAVSLSAGIEITGLDKVAVPLLRDLIPDAATWRAELERWGNVGDRLFDRVKKELPDDGLASALGEFFLGEGSSAGAAAVVDRLAAEVKSLADERISTWERDADAVAAELLPRALDRLGVGGGLRDMLIARYAPVVSMALNGVGDELRTALRNRVSTGGTALKPLIDLLDSLGEDGNQLGKGIAADADAIVAPVRRQLARYQELRNRVIAALERTGQLKLGVELGRSWARVESNRTLLGFRILKDTPRTRQIYRALMTGRIDRAWPEFESARQAGEVDSITGSFAASVNTRREIGFAINLGGLALSSKRIQLSDVQVEVDPSGMVLVAATGFSQQSASKGFKEKRDVNIVGGFELIAAADNMVAQPLGLSLSMEDERGMEPKELEQYLGSLERPNLEQPLLARGATAKAVDKYTQVRSSVRATRVDIALRVDADALRRLLQAADDAIFDRACHYQVEVKFRDPEAHRKYVDFAMKYPPANRSLTGFIREIGRMPIDRAREKYNRLACNDAFPSAKKVNDPLTLPIKWTHFAFERATGIVDAVKGLREMSAVKGEVERLGLAPAEKAREFTKRAGGINDRVNDALRDWISAQGPLAGSLREDVPWQTVAFLALLADLIGSTEPLLMPLITVDRGRINQVGGKDLARETWLIV